MLVSSFLGDKTIKHRKCAFLAAIAAPLALAGCAVPLGVQIASLFADGVSLVTTDKTLTDHGISAITNKDCAVWRGFKGEDVCQDEAFDPSAVAEIDGQEPAPAEPPEKPGEKTLTPVETNLPDVVETDENDVIDMSSDDAPGTHLETALVVSVDTNPVPAEITSPLPEMAEIQPEGGTYFIIASYRRLENARRFVEAKKGQETQLISGTAAGRPVYRVAVGPVEKTNQRHTRKRLIKVGYKDVWTLRLKNPKVVLELATLN